MWKWKVPKYRYYKSKNKKEKPLLKKRQYICEHAVKIAQVIVSSKSHQGKNRKKGIVEEMEGKLNGNI
jgi:hypothetical protein